MKKNSGRWLYYPTSGLFATTRGNFMYSAFRKISLLGMAIGLLYCGLACCSVYKAGISDVEGYIRRIGVLLIFVTLWFLLYIFCRCWPRTENWRRNHGSAIRERFGSLWSLAKAISAVTGVVADLILFISAVGSIVVCVVPWLMARI